MTGRDSPFISVHTNHVHEVYILLFSFEDVRDPVVGRDVSLSKSTKQRFYLTDVSFLPSLLNYHMKNTIYLLLYVTFKLVLGISIFS